MTYQTKTVEWFSEWFDSPYYHILYKNRDEEEAKFFISNLIDYLQIQSEEKILDIACGRGRHAIFLNQKGFDVVGADLSENNIAFAKQFENEQLKFYVNDMRKLLFPQEFDYVLNLFTSFGYFEDDSEDLQVIQAIADSLKPNGKLVIDFLNPSFVQKGLISEEKKVLDNIPFWISKKLEGGFIKKGIQFEVEGKLYQFEEKVKLIELEKFKDYFSQTNLKILDTFGDYNLQPYHSENSERLILIAQK